MSEMNLQRTRVNPPVGYVHTGGVETVIVGLARSDTSDKGSLFSVKVDEVTMYSWIRPQIRCVYMAQRSGTLVPEVSKLLTIF